MAADWTSALNRARDHAPFLARALERRPELAELMASGDGEAALRAAKQVRATDVASAARKPRNNRTTTTRPRKANIRAAQ